MSFYIWDKKHLCAISTIENVYDTFETEEEAEHEITVQRLKYKTSPHDYVIKTLPDEFWCVDARDNLAHNVWDRPVWYHEPWYQERMEDIKAYAHVAQYDAKSITYYENSRNGAKGKFTATTPGRFLQKYFGDRLTQKQIHTYAEMHKEQWVDPPQLLWAITPEEIAAVYQMQTTSWWSCMQYKVGEHETWPNDTIHPAYAYGAGDIWLAYIMKGAKLSGRVLVWHDKKLVGRFYGDVTSLRSALFDYGIQTKSNTESYDAFVGAKLLYLPYEGDEDIPGPKNAPAITVPFLDSDDGDGLILNPDGKTLTIVNQHWDDVRGVTKPAEWSAEWNTGVIRKRATCPLCGESVCGGWRTIIGKDGAETYFCEDCCERQIGSGPKQPTNNVILSDFSTKLYDARYYLYDAVLAYTPFGNVYMLGVRGVDPYSKSMKSKEFWRNEDLVTMANGDVWGKGEVELHAFQSTLDGKLYPFIETGIMA